MTKDDFRKHQKALCPPRKGGPGNRGIYGCGCCRSMSLGDFKQYTRRLARVLFHRETVEVIEEQLDLMGYEPDYCWEEWDTDADREWWDQREFSPGRKPLKVRLFELAGGLHV